MQFSDAALCAAADTTCHLQTRGFGAATGCDKRLQRLQFSVGGIDPAFKVVYGGLLDSCFFQYFSDLLGVRRGEPPAYCKECLLNSLENFAFEFRRFGRDCRSDKRIELVDFSIGTNAQRTFFSAAAAEICCRSGVAGSRVDTHCLIKVWIALTPIKAIRRVPGIRAISLLQILSFPLASFRSQCGPEIHRYARTPLASSSDDC